MLALIFLISLHSSLNIRDFTLKTILEMPGLRWFGTAWVHVFLVLSDTGQLACPGCNVFVWCWGRGSATGNKVIPVLIWRSQSLLWDPPAAEHWCILAWITQSWTLMGPKELHQRLWSFSVLIPHWVFNLAEKLQFRWSLHGKNMIVVI